MKDKIIKIVDDNYIDKYYGLSNEEKDNLNKNIEKILENVFKEDLDYNCKIDYEGNDIRSLEIFNFGDCEDFNFILENDYQSVSDMINLFYNEIYKLKKGVIQ